MVRGIVADGPTPGPGMRLGSRQPKHEPPRGSQAWNDRVRLSLSFVHRVGTFAATMLDSLPNSGAVIMAVGLAIAIERFGKRELANHAAAGAYGFLLSAAATVVVVRRPHSIL